MFIYKSKFIKSLIAKTFLIAITIILIINNNNRNNYVAAQELLYSDNNNNNNNDNENEEMTTSNLHFNFNNENNSGEMSDLIQKLYQLKNYNNQDDIIKQQQQQQQQQQKHKQWNNEFDEITNTSHNDTNNNNNKFPSSIISSTSTTSSSSSSVSSEEKYYKDEDFLLTTMVPLSDFIQMFSTTQSPSSLSTSLSSSSSMNLSIIDNVKNFNSDEDNDYIKVNESRSSTLIESNQTPASYLMRKNIYIPQMKNINIDNDLTSSVNNLSIVTTNDTLDMISNNSNNTNIISYMNSYSNNSNNNNNDSINVTDTISSFSSPIASPYISTLSGEDYFNENQMLGMKTISEDDINDEDDNNNNNDTINNEDIQNHEDEIFNLNINSENNNNNNDTSPFNAYLRHQQHKQIYQNNDDINFSEMNENDNIDNDMNNSDIMDLEQIDNFDGTTTLSSLPIAIPMSFMPPPTITTATATAAASSSSSSSSTSALTTTTTTTSTTTMTTLRTKQGKQIHINKLLPHEALRNFIEDAYIRPPLAILVDTSFNSLEKAKVLWKDALRSNAAALDIVLLAFNASGVSVTYQFQNTRTLLAGLDNIKESTTGGNAFFAIIRACELIPYDSAIFISTASIPADINLAQYAAITLLKKRIRLYLIWFGDNTFSENETQEVTGGILGEVAIRSGGEILHIGNDTKFEDDNILTLSDSNYQGNQEFEIPTETTMSNFHVKVDTLMRTAATMVTPNGDYETIDDDIIDDNVDDDDLQTLNLIDRSERKFKNFENIENPTVVITHENIRFPEDVEQIHDNENDENKENNNNDDDDDTIDIETTVKITDKEIEKLAKQFIFPNQGITKIDLSSQSQLLVTPGMIAQIYFEVTNTRTEAVFYNIRVTDEKGYLLSLNPRSISLPPGQTITVTLSVIIPSGTPQGTKDKITFICQGYGQASQSVELKVTSASEIQDATAPTLTWIFGARCDGQFNSGACSQRIWNLEVIAHDWETGILRVESTPHGIIPRIPFVVGTTEQVRLSYTATCCQPRVTINAYDLAGNQRTSTIDVRDIVLNEASIAAIVLGILLLIALIILIIITIIWCCRKHKRSQDLPSFRSHPERTR